MNKSIFLCGFMGCGKSTIGRQIADEKLLPFIDFDEHLEIAAGSTIADTFSYFGESYFRKFESAELLKICTDIRANRKVKVIALGGGTIISSQNSQLVYASGTAFFIDTDFDTCYDRIKDDPCRPLVTTREELEELYNKRRPIYLKHAKYTVKGIEEIYAYL